MGFIINLKARKILKLYIWANCITQTKTGTPMLTEEDRERIGNTLMSFIKSDNEWTDFCNLIDKDTSLTSEQIFGKQKEKLVEIFEKYCTVKDRALGRPTSLSYSIRKPEDSFADEKIVTIEEGGSKNKAIVFTEKNDSLQSKYQYSLQKKGEIWLLDSKKRYSSWKKKWITESL